MEERLVEISMLDRVAASPIEVASAAIGARRSSDALGNLQQVDPVGGQSAIGLDVAAGTLMADQAVDVVRVAEVEGLVHPSVSGMAGGAGRPVALDADAEIVEEVLLTRRDRQGASVNVDGIALPLPVGRVHQLGCGFRMAFEASPSDRGTVGERLCEERAVIRVLRPLGKELLGMVADPRVARHEHDDRDNEQRQDRDQAQ